MEGEEAGERASRVALLRWRLGDDRLAYLLRTTIVLTTTDGVLVVERCVEGGKVRGYE